jgi:hypothetical protein
LHDAVTAEKHGIPSIGIMTTQFVSAAELMARVLGADGFRFVAIEHPISSASTEALQERALFALAQSEAILTGQQST